MKIWLFIETLFVSAVEIRGGSRTVKVRSFFLLKPPCSFELGNTHMN